MREGGEVRGRKARGRTGKEKGREEVRRGRGGGERREARRRRERGKMEGWGRREVFVQV